VIAAVLGLFAALDIIGHRTAPYFLAKLIFVVAVSAGCLLLTKDREALDTFSAVVAGLFALCAAAMTAGDRSYPNWWPLFLAFASGAVFFVFVTRQRRATLLAVAAIVGFRFALFIILCAVHR
jgi:hypothetical protein